MYQNIYFQFQKTNKHEKKKQEYKKAKETKEEKRISMENRLKKLICGRPGKNFSHHPHFQKQEFFWPENVFLPRNQISVQLHSLSKFVLDLSPTSL